MMESPPPQPPLTLLPLAENMGFPGSSLATPLAMDDDVVEISPPTNRRASQKQKEVKLPEIIDVDMDDNFMDIVLLDNNDKAVDKLGKGKKALFPQGSSSGIGTKSLEKSHASNISDYFIDADDYDYGSESSYYGEKEMLFDESPLMDLSTDDYFGVDQYAILQSHLDDLDVPPGVEVPVPWFINNHESKKKSTDAKASKSTTSAAEWEEWGIPSDPASTLPSQLEKLHCTSSSGGYSFGAKPRGLRSYKNWESPYSSMSHFSQSPYSSMSEHFSQFGKADASSSVPEAAKGSSNPSSKSEGIDSLSKFNKYSDSLSKFNKQYQSTIKRFSDAAAATGHKRNKPNSFRAQKEAALKALGELPEIPDVPMLLASNIPNFKPGALSMKELYSLQSRSAPELPGTFSCNEKYGDPKEFLKKFEQFKQFDIVEDFTDHYYAKKSSYSKQPPKNWAKKIQDEWRILENDLPDTIFVRVYETRMDLMRAVIIGAEGTPYHDGLFFFDIIFPSNYPQVPPTVHYHAHGHRINPNLYNCGKVCLSLLNTWSGSTKEKWIPSQSTALQVLVSIQGLILNANPYFNEPGYAHQSNTPGGQKSSRGYNENTFILSLKTMLALIRNPPKYFKEFVAGHFLGRAKDILVACKAYVDGAQVGCLVRGGVQDVDEGDTSCSHFFKQTVAGNIKTLVAAFKVIGATDLESFLSVEAPKYVPPPLSRANQFTSGRNRTPSGNLMADSGSSGGAPAFYSAYSGF